MSQAEHCAQEMMAGYPLVADTLHLAHAGHHLCLRSNSATLIERLRRYFSHVLAKPHDREEDVIAIERDTPDLGVEYIDWQREPGKTARKDAYHELADGRLIHKVRTGMLFLQSKDLHIAAGPCEANDNQIINFINAQLMNRLQQRGDVICHASAIERNGKALAIAGFSGGGKSTLMLHMLEKTDTRYLSNDRLFIHRASHGALATGIPKLPRINPGTIIHNQRLAPMLNGQRRAELAALPRDQLWQLEEKHDVMIDELYGPGKVADRAPLAAVLLLAWDRNSTEPTTLERVDLCRHRELLPAIMKSPGPFYQGCSGHFISDDPRVDEQPYLDALDEVPTWVARGGVDFASICKQLYELLP